MNDSLLRENELAGVRTDDTSVVAGIVDAITAHERAIHRLAERCS